jgi:hypothetical protein
MVKPLESYDLSKKSHRYLARKAGYDVPILPNNVPKKTFWEQVEKTDGCWLWTGRTDRCGYGIYNINNFCHKAHRYAYEQISKEKIGKKIAMHTCDTPKCVNPNHIMLGTHQDNQKDKFQKNRQAKGQKIHTAKLTDNDIFQLRQRYKNEKITYLQLAKEFGVCRDTIQKAIRGIYWKHL